MTSEEFLNNEIGDAHQTYDDVGITILHGIEHSQMCEILDRYHEHKLKENTGKPRYSVSLVYLKNIPLGQEISLKTLITSANSEEEALGKAMFEFEDECKNYNLSNKVVLKHK